MAINEPRGKIALVLLGPHNTVYKVFILADEIDYDEAVERADSRYGQELAQTEIVEVDSIDDLLEAIDNLNEH